MHPQSAMVQFQLFYEEGKLFLKPFRMFYNYLIL